MLLDGLLVEGIEDRHLPSAAGSRDLLGHCLEVLAVAPGQEDRGPLAGDLLGDCSADRPTGSVDDAFLFPSNILIFSY